MAEKKKTTKEILQEKLAGQKRTPLYNPVALEKLRQGFEGWRNTAVGAGDRSRWYGTPQTILGSDIPREMLYTPLSSPNLDYMQDIGHSGQEPFARGIHANMYRGKEFTMRQLTGFGGPEETNQRVKFMIAHGGTGINVLFDLPTIQMYDSDDPIAKGQVGMSGVAVDSVEDMDLLFKDIPLNKVTVSLVTHYPSNTAILFPMYLYWPSEGASHGINCAGVCRMTSPWKKSCAAAPNTYPRRMSSESNATILSSSGRMHRYGISLLIMATICANLELPR